MFRVNIENEVFCLSIGEIVGEWKLVVKYFHEQDALKFIQLF